MNKKGQATTTVILVVAAVMGLGAYMTEQGKWGADGTEAIKNCVGTHTNGNCAHLPLTSSEQFVDFTNFAGE